MYVCPLLPPCTTVCKAAYLPHINIRYGRNCSICGIPLR